MLLHLGWQEKPRAIQINQTRDYLICILMTNQHKKATDHFDSVEHLYIELHSTCTVYLNVLKWINKLTLQFQAGRVDAVRKYPDNGHAELGGRWSCWLVKRTVQTSSGAVGRAPANRKQLAEDASEVLCQQRMTQPFSQSCIILNLRCRHVTVNNIN